MANTPHTAFPDLPASSPPPAPLTPSEVGDLRALREGLRGAPEERLPTPVQPPTLFELGLGKWEKLKQEQERERKSIREEERWEREFLKDDEMQKDPVGKGRVCCGRAWWEKVEGLEMTCHCLEIFLMEAEDFFHNLLVEENEDWEDLRGVGARYLSGRSLTPGVWRGILGETFVTWGAKLAYKLHEGKCACGWTARVFCEECAWLARQNDWVRETHEKMNVVQGTALPVVAYHLVTVNVTLRHL